MSKKSGAGGLSELSAAEIKSLIKQLEQKNNEAEARNQELVNTAANLRSLVRKVDAEYEEDIAFEKRKGQQLDSEIESLEKALAVALDRENNTGEVADFMSGS